MNKKLSEMSLDELWHLFPIILEKHKTYWSQWFQEEKILLQTMFHSSQAVRISHIGSTAVPAIWAKPIIDIMIEITKDCSMCRIKEMLVKQGYICMSENENRISFNKGYTENGFAKKVFHLHLRYAGDNDELYFRDYLIEYPEIAKQYEKLKLALWQPFKYNRDGYTKSKTAFIKKYTICAKEKYKDKY